MILQYFRKNKNRVLPFTDSDNLTGLFFKGFAKRLYLSQNQAFTKDMNQKDVIMVDAEILGGTPVFRGTRIAVKTLFDYLEVSSLDDFLEGYPSVSREHAEAVIELAASLLNTFTRHYEAAA